MKPLALAQQYLEMIFSGKDPGGLRPLLDENLVFKGPLYEFDSAGDYIQSLKANPFKDARYTIISSYEDETSACLVYKFSKPGISVPMSQIFNMQNDKISHILLIFDTRNFIGKKLK